MPATIASSGLRVGEPRIVERAARHVAVIRTTGRPGEVGPTAIPQLYRAVYGLKMGRKRAGGEDFKVEPLRARWPNAHVAAPDDWIGEWALPIPEDVDALPPTTVETWEYGLTAELLHVGSYEREGPSVERLHAFVAEQGYALAGPHEEEYLTRPGSLEQRTVIRYPVRRR